MSTKTEEWLLRMHCEAMKDHWEQARRLMPAIATKPPLPLALWPRTLVLGR